MPDNTPIKPSDNRALVDIILAYLRGAKIGRIKFELQTQCDKYNIACKERYAQLKADDTNVDYNDAIKRILHELSDDQINDHLNGPPNLYTVLNRLSIKHPHLNRLIELIDETRPAHNWPLYFMLTIGVITGAGLFMYLKEHFELVRAWYLRTVPSVLNWFHSAVHILRTTPLIGILSRALPLGSSWYQAMMNGSITHSKKRIRLFFNTLEHGLPIAGYVLCFLAAGVMTLPALALFVAGATIDVVETLYTWISNEIDRIRNPLPPVTNYYSETATARADNAHYRNRFVFVVNLIANILLLASVVIWCVFPPSLIIVVPCFVFGWLVVLAKGAILAQTANENADELQKELRDIEIKYPEQASNASSYFSIGKSLNEQEAKPAPRHQKSMHPKENKTNVPMPVSSLSSPGLFKVNIPEQSDNQASFVYN